MEKTYFKNLTERPYDETTTRKDFGEYNHGEKTATAINDTNPRLIEQREASGLNLKKTLKDSLVFGKLFRSLMSKDNHYITYLNESFNCPKNEVYIPDHISCIVKDYSDIGSMRAYYECVGSRLANVFGVDTVFNLAIESVHHKEYDEPEYDKVISVDYVPYGYRTETLLDLGIGFDEDIPLSVIMQRLDVGFAKIEKKENVNATPERRRAIKEALAKQFLFRVLICEDNDFASQNVCTLLGDNGDILLGPSFDYELFVDGGKSRGYYREMADDAIEYMQDEMPEVLYDFVTRMTSKYRSGEISKTIESSIKAPSRWAQTVKESVIKNCKRLTEIYNEHIHSQPTLEN